MANLNTQEQDENNLSQFRQLKSDAGRLISQCTAWNGTFNTLYGDVNAESQAILDAKKAAFINAMKTALGL